jgi:MFS family permease
VFAGYGLASLAKAAIAAATTWPFVLFCRVLDRVGKGLRTAPRDALIEADTTQANRGRAFGFHRAMDSLGAVVGPLIGLALFEAFHRSLRPLFVVGVIPALISVGFIWFVKEVPPKATAAATRMRWDFSRRYWTVLSLLTAFNLVNFSVGLIIVKVKELGIDTIEIFLIYALYNLMYAVFSYPAGRLSDRLPRRLVFAAGLAVFAASFIGFAFARAELWAWLLFALFGAFMALTDGVGTAWVADLAPRDRVGSALGIYYAASGFATIIAGLWAGLFWAGTGFVPFVVAGSTAAVLAAALLLLQI